MGPALASLMLGAALGGGTPVTPAAASIAPEEIGGLVSTYHIPPGSMASALNDLADAAGLHVAFEARLAQGLRTSGLSGRHSLREALDRLLAGTDLIYRFADNRRAVLITLAQNDTGARSDAGPEALPTIDIGAEAQRQPGRANGRGSGGPGDPAAYKVWNTSTATKTNTPVMQTPFNVQTVPRQVIQDQQAVTIDDALKNVSGVTPITYFGTQADYMVRGFLTRQFEDNIPLNSFWNRPPRETADLQQIDVLKGPASIMYGRMDAGGAVALTTRKPQSDPHYELQQMFGSYGFYRTTVGMMGPVTSDKSVLYRFDAAYENAQSFRDQEHSNHVYIAPRVTWAPTQDTSFETYFQYYTGRLPFDTGIPAISNGVTAFVAPVPISRNYSGSGSAQYYDYYLRGGLTWSHAFDENWKFTHRVDYGAIDMETRFVNVFNPNPANCTLISCPLGRRTPVWPIVEQRLFTSAELTGHFDTFGVKHTLLMGADLFRYQATGTPIYVNRFGVPGTDLFHPAPERDVSVYAYAFDRYLYSRVTTNWVGAYFQDQMELPYDFHLLAGFRYDTADESVTDRTILPAIGVAASASRDDAIKPRIGLLWQPIPELSVYGNYVEGFAPSNGRNPNSRPISPQEARQWEAGAKVELLDRRLSATAAWFEITKSNMSTPHSNPDLRDLGYSETTGAVRSTGFDIDIQGQVTPELKFIGGYANTDVKIISDNSSNVGHRWYGTPRHSGNLWAVYEPQAALFKGLALGAGFVARGSVWADNANTLKLPAYATVDLMARYQFDYDRYKITAQLNVSNLLDQRYYLPGWGSTGNILPGAPTMLRGALKVEF